MNTTDQRITALEAQVARLIRLLESQGISDWQSPSQAATALGVSHYSLKREIARSRLNPKRSDLKEGVHFRNIGSPDAERPTWQINVPRFREFLAIPIEKRKA